MAEIEIPPYFLCPISLEIMKDPVTISTGISYDRDSIEKWMLIQRKNTCPVTKQLLSDVDLTPNIILRRLIQSWCILHSAGGVDRLPTPTAPATQSQILKLLQECESPELQMSCLRRLKSIAFQNLSNKRSMEIVGAAKFLADLVVKKIHEAAAVELDDDCSEEKSEPKQACELALTILYSLQLSESSLQSICSEQFVESLTKVMQFGSYESRAYAIFLLQSILEAADSPQILLNLPPEIFIQFTQILSDEFSRKATKSTLKTLINVCPWGRNRIKAVESGAVPLLINLLLDSSEKRISEMILLTLDILCQCAEGRAELLNHPAGLAVVSKKILRISTAASEAAIRVLQSVSKFCSTPRVLQEMLQIGVPTKLCLVMQDNSGSKFKERAREILRLHAKTWRNSLCIPSHLVSFYPS